MEQLLREGQRCSIDVNSLVNYYSIVTLTPRLQTTHNNPALSNLSA